MSAYQLIIGLRKDKIANLRASIDAAQLRKIDSVPESDALVSCATASCQEASVEGAPINGFDSGLMIWKSFQGSVWSSWPNEKLIIIASWSQLVFIM